MNTSYWLGIVFGLIVLLSVFFKMRNKRMKEGYATWWIVIALFSVFFSVAPGVLKTISTALGVQVPLNLGFFLAGLVMLLLSLRFSVDLSRSAEERRRLTEEIAILKEEVEELKSELNLRR